MTAYYNENDPKAAAWLRELERQGLIAPGEVDERDIRDVRPADLYGFAQCHFFAGIGVWSYALRKAGWPDDRPAWTGSCPCQPFSAAGKGEGFDDERHLWPAWFWLVEQCRPRIVFGEQVASKAAEPWLDLVQADLEGLGYAFGACAFPSAGVGAPHIRDRTYWLADSQHTQRRPERQIDGNAHGRHGLGRRGDVGGVAHGDDARPQGRIERGNGAAERFAGAGGMAGGLALTDDTERRPDTAGRHDSNGRDAGWAQSSGDAQGRGSDGGVADDARSGRREERQDAGRLIEGDRAQGVTAGLGDGGELVGVADADQLGAERERRDASEEARFPQAQCEPEHDTDVSQRSGADGERPDDRQGDGLRSDESWPGPANGLWRNADWLLCRDGKWRPVEPGTFPLAHGAPARVGRLRGYGNAINAEAATAFIEAYLG